MKRRILTGLLACCLSLSLALPGFAAGAIPSPGEVSQVVTALGILDGNSSGSLELSRNVTRAEFITMALKASPNGDQVGEASTSPYPDVPYTHWAAGYVEAAVAAAEEEFGVEQGRTLLMAALESPRGILNAYEICAASDRMFGVAISGGDLRKCLQTSPQRDGVDMLAARGQVILAARAAGIQCFDTVFTDLDDQEGFEAEVLQNKAMGFDGKSLINPKQIRFVHQVFAPTEKEVRQAEKILRAYREQSAAGVGVFTVDGKMIDIAFIPGAERTLKLARACGMYDGEV